MKKLGQLRPGRTFAQGEFTPKGPKTTWFRMAFSAKSSLVIPDDILDSLPDAKKEETVPEKPTDEKNGQGVQKQPQEGR